ncbi:ABC transporter ATP-binding protein [Paraclostridium sp. AKS73]|uniref:ABC transporter ATP-binding protein n=1 Tax=Paraclostridium sp. AKS73 TaxID=2876116 RepID=UPI002FCCC720
MLKVINLNKSIKNNKNTFKILENINLEVKDGEFISIMGPSGAGKTTLLNIMSTIDRPSEGKVYYDNEDVHSLKNKELSRFRRDNIGFIFQDYNLLDNMSIEDNIALPLVIANEKPDKIQKEVEKLASFWNKKNI